MRGVLADLEQHEPPLKTPVEPHDVVDGIGRVSRAWKQPLYRLYTRSGRRIVGAFIRGGVVLWVAGLRSNLQSVR